MFGVKSEKIVVQLEQLELHLEELESSQAEMETAVERVTPAAEPKARSGRKPLPEHIPREVVTHAFHSDSCPDFGGSPLDPAVFKNYLAFSPSSPGRSIFRPAVATVGRLGRRPVSR
jgi:hypothetical protein